MESRSDREKRKKTDSYGQDSPRTGNSPIDLTPYETGLFLHQLRRAGKMKNFSDDAPDSEPDSSEMNESEYDSMESQSDMEKRKKTDIYGQVSRSGKMNNFSDDAPATVQNSSTLSNITSQVWNYISRGAERMLYNFSDARGAERMLYNFSDVHDPWKLINSSADAPATVQNSSNLSNITSQVWNYISRSTERMLYSFSDAIESQSDKEKRKKTDSYGQVGQNNGFLPVALCILAFIIIVTIILCCIKFWEKRNICKKSGIKPQERTWIYHPEAVFETEIDVLIMNN